MRLNLKTAPASEPLSLEEAKAHLRVDGADENTLISELIVAAREFAENTTHRALITQTWELVLDKAGSEIEVPLPPLQEVSKIETIDEDGVKAEVPTAYYLVDASGAPGRIRLAPYYTWPEHRGFASFIVTFKAGYGLAASSVPKDIRTAIRQLVGLLYENRGAVDVLLGTHPLTNQQQLIMALLAPYRVIRL